MKKVLKVSKPRLVDAIKMNQQHPNTFYLPKTDNIKKGDSVKVIFTAGERLWITVKSVKEDIVVGTIDNFPIIINYNYGDYIQFKKKHICDIFLKQDKQQ